MALSLRPIAESDCDAVVDLLADPAISQMAVTIQFPYTAETFREKFDRMRVPTEQGRVAEYILLHDERTIGSCCYFSLSEGEPFYVGYWLGREFWGKGFASEALLLLLAKMQARAIPLPVTAHVAVDNIASQRVLEKAGFRQVRQEVFFVERIGRDIDEYVMVLEAWPGS